MCLIVKLCELRGLYVTCVQWSQLCNMDTLGPLSSLSSSLYVLNSYSGTFTKCVHYTGVFVLQVAMVTDSS